MRKLALLVLLSCMMVASFGCRATDRTMLTPSQDIASYDATTKDVRAAIIKACTSLTWKPKDKNATTIVASILVRNKHTVVVEIPYTATSFSINYVSSTNMDAKPDGTIHTSYNNWVLRLSQTIDQELNLQSL